MSQRLCSLLPAEFARACAQTRPVVLAGAGISLLAPACLPTAIGLLRGFQAALSNDAAIRKLYDELPPDPFGPLLSPELFYNAIGEYSVAVAADAFRTSLWSEEPNLNHWIIASLFRDDLIGDIITTNFDDLLERALGDAKYHLHSEEQERSTERTLWKIHGDLDKRMAIAMSDVAAVGFSATPGGVAEMLVGRELIVVGYSGNDPHVLRTLIDAQPSRVWWVARPGDRPSGLLKLCRAVAGVAIVEGDLTSVAGDNPLVALWSIKGRGHVPPALVNRARDPAARHQPSHAFTALDKLSPGLKGLIVHSLVRRAGIEPSAGYREALSACLKNSLFAQGFSDSLGWAIHKDVSDAYESMLQPHVYARPTVLEGHGVGLVAADRGRTFRARLEALEPPVQAMILLDAGLERLYHGDSENAVPALLAALRCGEKAAVTSVATRASEALAWAHLANSDLPASMEAHSTYRRLFQSIRQDIKAIGRGIEIVDADRVLSSSKPPDEPEFYRLVSLDRRFKKRLSPLRLAGRLRYYGRPDFALDLLEASRNVSLPASIYAKVVESFEQLETARCQALLARSEEALDSLRAARRLVRDVEDAQSRVFKSFHRLASACFVRLEQIPDALASNLDARRIPT